MGVDAALEHKIGAESDEAALVALAIGDDVRFCLQRNRRIYAYGAVASHKLAKRLDDVPFSRLPYLRPDGKTQNTISMKAISRYVSILSSFLPSISQISS